MNTASPLRLSEAASIALHTAALLAGQPKRLFSAPEIAERIHVSAAHLEKVLQRLHKAGLLDSVRGRTGGFTLAKPARRISLLDVYEAIEGKLPRGGCVTGRAHCGATRCVFGQLLPDLDRQVWGYFQGTKLSDLADVYETQSEAA